MAVHRETAVGHYNCHAHSLPDISIGSNVAVQNCDTKQWDLGPYHKYYAKHPVDES
jgi:hypothetical protein